MHIVDIVSKIFSIVMCSFSPMSYTRSRNDKLLMIASSIKYTIWFDTKNNKFHKKLICSYLPKECSYPFCHERKSEVRNWNILRILWSVQWHLVTLPMVKSVRDRQKDLRQIKFPFRYVFALFHNPLSLDYSICHSADQEDWIMKTCSFLFFLKSRINRSELTIDDNFHFWKYFQFLKLICHQNYGFDVIMNE